MVSPACSGLIARQRNRSGYACLAVKAGRRCRLQFAVALKVDAPGQIVRVQCRLLRAEHRPEADIRAFQQLAPLVPQQQVEVVEAGGHPGQPSVAEPGRPRCGSGFAVLAQMVGAGDVAADGCVQLGQRQPRRGGGLAAYQVAGQLGQQLGVQRAEQPLHFAPALGPPDGRVDQLDAQVGGDLAEVGAGEVAAVV